MASINSSVRKQPTQVMQTVVISRTHNKAFGKLVGKTVENGRKEGSPFYMDEKYVYLPIKSIAVTEVNSEVYNFSVEEDESYVAEGVISHNCTAPIFTTDSLHSAVVEILVKKGARVRYTTIQNWSKNVYNLVTKRMFVEEEGFGEWIDGNLGCLTSGSTVTTAKGLKNIEDIRVGEKILSYDEKNQKLCFRRVTATRFSGLQQVHKVSTRGRALYATSNHPFYSYTYDVNRPRKLTRYNYAYVRADNLKQVIVPKTSINFGESQLLIQPPCATSFITQNQYVGNLQVVRMRQNTMLFPTKTTPDIMWLFGLFLGDGSIEKKYGANNTLRWGKVIFSVPTNDRAYTNLLRVMNKIYSEKHVTVRKDKITSTWNDVRLVEFFEYNGFVTGSKNKRLPLWVYSTTEEERLALLAGYIESNGTCTVKREKYSIKSINEILIEQIGKLLTTLGIQFSIHKEIGKKVSILNYVSQAQDSFRIEFNIDQRILPYVSEATRGKIKQIITRKYRYYRKVGRSNLTLPDSLELRTVNISPLSEIRVPTWDIEVEGTGNFISEGFIVHNSQLTMKYPSIYLKGRKARGEILSLAFAGKGQHQDAGGKAIHLAPETTSVITSKSVSKDGGRTSYRGLLKVIKGAKDCKSTVRCDALILDPKSRSDTYPTMDIQEERVTIGHEASVSRIGEEQLFYFQSRGIPMSQAEVMIVNGFVEPIVRELPMEYAVELNRLIQLEMVGSVG